MTDTDFVALLDERNKMIAREVLQAILPDAVPLPAIDESSARLRRHLEMLRVKEHVTVKEAALILTNYSIS
jgi:hypothetical protein